MALLASAALNPEPVVKQYLRLIFSRQGQEKFAFRNQVPLPADQIIKARAILGL